MTCTLIDGKKLAAALQKQIAAEVSALHATTGTTPGLCILSVGDDAPSRVYIRNKVRACAAVGIRAIEVHKETATTEGVVALLRELNGDESVNGIIVQLPLPPSIDAQAVLDAIAHHKDVDGLHPSSFGRLAAGNEEAVPCTPKGIVYMLEQEQIPIAGRHAVIVGRSKLVGRPLAYMLLNRHATVTVCHTKTEDLAYYTRQADILVAAAGSPGLITGSMVKKGAAVIDVGIHVSGGSVSGDVEQHSVKEKAAYLTPVPGGVGPMTVAMLLKNTVEAFKKQQKQK
ncbi:MAG: bifunctional methylenetetrahydrofolate dehydrogenase/methenyltetrahydrofolate cyclohydrolase FolD [Candidatus Aenigmarchaeota archaeon]|nr:bifunctional methylenetetrahydrofolate dehydrogenase/methenyltetrahydrofolate cyclohydrolase FolD [Candidatus Aenigmarchaeota archaeon]